jgi:3-oxoacyl-[acyl-carrier-protein] synthase-1
MGRGHAGSIAAIQRVVEESSRGVEGLFLIVGADSYHHADTFTWLERNRRFAQPSVRSEGLGLQSLAVLGGVGTAQETLLRDSETGSFGAGMTQAVLGATEGLHLPQDAVDTLYSDINGERYRSEEWGFVAMKTYSLWRSLEYEAPGSSWGDVGAAFGPLAGVLAVQAYRKGYANGPRTVVMAGSDSGLRGAILLRDARAQ